MARPFRHDGARPVRARLDARTFANQPFRDLQKAHEADPVTATPILETLAREFSIQPEHVASAFEMLDAGLSAPFIGRFRRARIAALSESMIRRLQRRRVELEELDRRRGTIVRLLEKAPGVTPEHLNVIQNCMDRFELEDLFIPHRRPEPEVQLAIDRGLAPLADLLVAPVPREERGESEEKETHEGLGDDEHNVSSAATPTLDGGDGRELSRAATAVAVESEPYSQVESLTSALEAPAAELHASDAQVADAQVADAQASDPQAADAHAQSDEEEEAKPAPLTLDAPAAAAPHVDLKTAMNAQLARVCQPFVKPERGIHTESEALAGALRILSDRLGRNARLRSGVRELLRRHGVLSVRPTIDEGRLGRHKSLLRINQPLRQVQGHRLLAIRQAQKERVLNTLVTLDVAKVLPKVRAALGKHTHPAYKEVLDEVALQALNYRLLPMVEQDVRLELKERADQEALRFLSQHLRQILLSPPLPPRTPALGIDVNAKGDFTLVVVDGDGRAIAPETKIETKKDGVDKTPEELGQELAAVLGAHHVRHATVGHGKGPRSALPKIRKALAAAKVDAWVFLVNEAGLSSYANSEIARSELSELNVPARMAASLARRLQDPQHEILKVDPRHLGLGAEQGLVSKANAKRVFVETIESCTAHVGCDVNRAPLSFLAHLPGLSRDSAKKIIARRAERPFQSREELRAEGVLSEAEWTSVAAFLRVPNGSDPLDATNLHPEQYPLVQKLLEAAGSGVEHGLGRMGSTKGLRRADFDVDEFTWRDLMREIAHPGRDPRPRLYGPTLLEVDTDPTRLTKDRVIEGIVSNVASFGGFVDVGLAQDAMVHISEISDRYVRDARELLSIGQVVRLRILDAGGQRLSLSLKNVPAPERPERFRGPRRPRGEDGGSSEGQSQGQGQGQGHGGGGGGGGRGRPRGERRGGFDRAPEKPANIRAATTRRDGIGTRSSGRGGGGGGGGGQRGAPRRDDRGARSPDAGDREDVARLAAAAKNKPSNNPFASFFKKKEDEPGESAST
jgi:protein Tex